MEPSEIIDTLGLVPHPEGGWYRETWRHDEGPKGADDGPPRGHGSAIYFLLVDGEHSHWHRVDAAEIWHHYDGAPLELWMAESDDDWPELHVLGTDMDAGERPQIVVPTRWWQSATTRGSHTLVGCTVAPGFDFAGFELAPEDWAPTGGSDPA